MKVRTRETLGDALHCAVHPGHPWSGCADPDRVYDVWLPRLIKELRRVGFTGVDLAAIEKDIAAARDNPVAVTGGVVIAGPLEMSSD